MIGEHYEGTSAPRDQPQLTDAIADCGAVIAARIVSSDQIASFEAVSPGTIIMEAAASHLSANMLRISGHRAEQIARAPRTELQF